MSNHSDTIMFLSLFLLILIAFFTAYYARQQGRNPVLWFVIGILLGIFGLLILLFYPSPKTDPKEGMPTMSVSEPDPALKAAHGAAPSTTVPASQEDDKLWFYLDSNHQQMGPVSIYALKELWNRGQLELMSYVWCEGMQQWELVDNLPELKISLGKM